jgi:hypothetical protein
VESESDKEVLRVFAPEARKRMLTAGWEAANVADGSSQFLGFFQRPVADDFLATVEFMLESGPVVSGGHWHPLRGWVKTREIRAAVGGEIGLVNLPTQRLLTALDARCEPNIAVDITQDVGAERTYFSDEATAVAAAESLVTVVREHALPFARSKASVEAMAEFASSGTQSTRDVSFEYFFVPTLFAANGRAQDARSALTRYQDVQRRSPDERQKFVEFSDRLKDWLERAS